ncbi:uncharacterized protein K460DRAFT_399893 [Cucurbitaria berberidis CBS 394.84]|uniref:Uncharacterized protein n=1 Tax=Cucurbitaria berberidis CBS 394.84 TaxID=1168544 RepID=A0A9P4GQZ9_9PLEO|nr:uncharacterized protein K460DRAFT_399893 [Cucurbitaria berberidis CBS 394.84]KAF1849781.1 hypothetical protein K460DRAFT_399893 [Cucurbitaria berberidis CBS 394.84]
MTSSTQPPEPASNPTQYVYFLITLTRAVGTDPFPPTEPWEGDIVGRWLDKDQLNLKMTELRYSMKSGSRWTIKAGEYTVAHGGVEPMKLFTPVIGRDVEEGGEKVWRLYWVEKRKM